MNLWRMLREYEALAGALREEAVEVARETMTRVLHNVGLLVPRLEARGWTSLGGSFHTPPSDEDAAVIREIETITGAPVPPGLKGFWETVGGLDLIWNYENGEEPPDFDLDLKIDQLDPVSVNPARKVSRTELRLLLGS